MKKIYLATPYSDRDPEVRESRFKAVNVVAADLMSKGFLVFSPISHTHPIALAGDLPKGWEFWQAYDETFIEWADELWVLPQAGWEDSVGVTAEIKLARDKGKIVRFLEQR